MQGRRPWLRLAGLALPFLTAGCMSGVVPGADHADPSCLLLCALTREITGDPAPAPAQVASAAVPARPAHAHRAAKPHAVAAAKPTRRVVAMAHTRPMRRRPAAEVSVIPQASPHPVAAKPVAMVPSAPAPVALAPRPPAPTVQSRSLSEAIPGSVGIMPPLLQGQ